MLKEGYVARGEYRKRESVGPRAALDMRLYTTNMCGIYCRLIWANLNVKDFCPQKLPIVALAYREYLLTGRTLCVKTFID